MRNLFLVGLLAAAVPSYALAAGAALIAADNCITERLKLYAPNTCEPTDTLISAAQASCNQAIEKAVAEDIQMNGTPEYQSRQVVDKTFEKLQGRYRQAVIEFRIFAKKECHG